MRAFLFFLLLALPFGGDLSAQNYTQAIGLRFGYPWAASYKFFPGGGSNAIEAFVGYRGSRVAFAFGRRGWRYLNVGALYQIHEDLDLTDLPGLSYYYGGGASAYLYSYDDDFVGRDGFPGVGAGLHGVLGLDYSFEDVPLNLSIDWVPTIRLGSGYLGTFGWDRGGLSARYIIGD